MKGSAKSIIFLIKLEKHIYKSGKNEGKKVPTEAFLKRQNI
jgi:hypothetical protein